MEARRLKLPRPPALQAQPAFGAALKSWRESVGWTQDKLALVLGISRLQVTRWENPEKNPGQEPALVAGRKYEAFRAGDFTSAVEAEIGRLQAELATLKKISFTAR